MTYRKRLTLLLIAMLALVMSLALIGCNDSNADKDITGVTFQDLTVAYDGNPHTMTITGTLPKGVTVVYGSNTATEVGEYVAVAALYGSGYKPLTLHAKLTITSTDVDIVGVAFKDLTVKYDGNPHTVTVTGTIPQGVSVSYKNNTATDVGEYTATATLSGKGYNTLTLTAKLAVEPADIDLTGIAFEDLTVKYDGNPHSVKLTGTLPQGVSVSYQDNTAVKLGEYKATATLYGKGYNSVTLTAILTVEPADIDTTGVSFNDLTVKYDGKPHSVLLSGALPQGIRVLYQNNTATEVGEYTVGATLYGEGYKTLTLTAKLIIEISQIDLTGVTFNDLTVDFDGNPHTITVSGTLPQGVSVSYVNNVATDAGRYVATAIFTQQDRADAVLTATLTINAVAHTVVTSAEELLTALSNGGLILFGDDITLDATIARIDKDTYLNGRGHTLTAVDYGNNYAVINVTGTDCKSVTISNLNIVADKWVQWLRGINVQASENLVLNITNVDVKLCDYYAFNILGNNVNLTVNMTDSKLSAWAAVYNRASGMTFNAVNCTLDGTNTHASPNTTSNYFSMFIVAEYVLLNDDAFIAENLSANNRFTLTDCELIARVAVDANGEPIDTMQKLFDIRSPYNNRLELIGCTFKPVKYEWLVFSAYDSEWIPDENRDDPDYVVNTNKVIIDGVDVTDNENYVEKYYDE